MTITQELEPPVSDADAMRTLRYENTERTAAMMACTADCVKLLRPDGTVAYMSQNGMCAMEIDDFSQVYGQRWSALWPSDASALIEQSMVQARNGKTAHFIADCPTAKGTSARWDVTVQAIFGDDGSLSEFIAVSRRTSDPTRPLTVC
ncbi:PAS domain-containing protein [uncultured Tateyamaria sp.]|uniref:PAS domain-containing protein n=1 Tax=uncultured Tateyamaria sp. TaxID=455651 RepID=UPI0026079A56|nr:PAS domain-containing protein [uncultured Tateyamaria sp.]